MLPDELWILIFNYLGPAELCKLITVSKLFSDLASSNEPWSRVAKNPNSFPNLWSYEKGYIKHYFLNKNSELQATKQLSEFMKLGFSSRILVLGKAISTNSGWFTSRLFYNDLKQNNTHRFLKKVYVGSSPRPENLCCHEEDLSLAYQNYRFDFSHDEGRWKDYHLTFKIYASFKDILLIFPKNKDEVTYILDTIMYEKQCKPICCTTDLSIVKYCKSRDCDIVQLNSTELAVDDTFTILDKIKEYVMQSKKKHGPLHCHIL